jgi:hypothetical protein
MVSARELAVGGRGIESRSDLPKFLLASLDCYVLNDWLRLRLGMLRASWCDSTVWGTTSTVLHRLLPSLSPPAVSAAPVAQWLARGSWQWEVAGSNRGWTDRPTGAGLDLLTFFLSQLPICEHCDVGRRSLWVVDGRASLSVRSR